MISLMATASRAELAVKELWPAKGATNICSDTPLRIVLSEPPALGSSGIVAVCRVSDNKVVDVIDLGAPGFTNNVAGRTLRYDPITIDGSTVSIQLHSRSLASEETYFVTIDRGVFKDTRGGEFAGVFAEGSWRFSTRVAPPKGRTNVVVAADGTGDFCSLQGAVDYIPDDNQAPFRISVRKGSYGGIVLIFSSKTHVTITGEDRRQTIIWGRNNDRQNPGRLGRPLVTVDANDFTIENLTLRNTTPYKGSQAEALCVKGERCILRNADFYSFQDTLLLSGQVYVTNCYIEGDVDFIWGQGITFFDHCEVKAVHTGYYLQSRNPVGRPGYVFANCKLTATPEVEKCWLARIDSGRFPGSQAAFINCQMGPQVPAAGWVVTGTNLDRLRFEEFHSTDLQGKPVDVSQRHPASKQLTEAEAANLSDPAKVFAYPETWNPREPSPMRTQR
jgi:Pectinesterase/Bacterial Ig-like domain